MTDASIALDELHHVLDALGPVTVAVSGGVDSMTLAVVAHRRSPERCNMIHAVSAAVPPQATARVRQQAHDEGWSLETIDAGEFADRRYLSNPANRCFFCKTNLYASMSALTAATLVSGTNTDDLGDYRPGLAAAEDHGVRHPFVEAGIDKATVRGIARHLALEGLAELPAAPCLSSRIETGIAIDPRVLPVVNDAERLIARTLSPHTVRCRVRNDGVVVELDEDTLAGAPPATLTALLEAIGDRFRAIGTDAPVRAEAYRMGSAFLRDTAS